MDLNQLRADIDSIDCKLVNLLNQRASIALKIGVYKKKNSIPVFDSSREQHVLKRLSDINKGPLLNNQLMEIFNTIMKSCREIQL